MTYIYAVTDKALRRAQAHPEADWNERVSYLADTVEAAVRNEIRTDMSELFLRVKGDLDEQSAIAEVQSDPATKDLAEQQIRVAEEIMELVLRRLL